MKPLKPFDIKFSGINLVEASAGTGKTYNITSLYIRALIELEITVNNILVVTYTEAATKELKDRLLKRIRQSVKVLKTNVPSGGNDQFLSELLAHVEDQTEAVKKLERAVQNFDEAAIYTIHGFCYQSLQEQAFESRGMYDAEMIGDDYELLQEAVDDYWRKWVQECSDNPQKAPLLKLLFDKGNGPEELAKELSSGIGKPYLQILPQDTDDTKLEQKLDKLTSIFSDLKFIWHDDRDEILRLLSQDMVKNYRPDWLEGWMKKMDGLLHSDTASINIFDQFRKFTQSLINDSLLKKAVRNEVEAPQHTFFDLADSYQELAESLQTFDVKFKKRLFLHLRDELQQKKEQQQVLSYDDLLLQLRQALNDEAQGERLANKLRTKYPIALVDEFQDTDPNQYEIFRSIYNSHKESALFMIGDPKQSIYSFRGADVFSYIEARRDAPKENTFNLVRNFRSTPKLLEGINTLFTNHQNPFIFNQIDFEPVKPGRNIEDYNQLTENGTVRPPIRFCQINTEEDQLSKKVAAEQSAHDTADEIFRLIHGGKTGRIAIGADPVQASDVAVLVRTHKQADIVREALQRKGIKSVQYSQQSVFKSEEARQLEVFLKAVTQPGNESLIRTALALPLTAFSAHALYELKEKEDRWIELLEQFSEWNQKWKDEGFSSMFRAILGEGGIAEHLIGYRDGERRLTNVLHLGELLQNQQNKEANSLLKWLAYKRNEEGKKQEEEQLRLESDDELVKIVTMHRSKGLEYAIVFCPFLWHGPELRDRGRPLIFHDPSELHKTYMDFTGKAGTDHDQNRWLSAREELAESMRLAYVAVTRAKQCCYLTWTYAGKSEFSPLSSLLLGSESTQELLKNTIFGKYDAGGREEMQQAIQRLCASHPELFTMKDDLKTSQNQLELLGNDQNFLLKSRSFQRTVPLKNSYRVSSFSSLTSWMEDEPDKPDYDQFSDTAFPQEEETSVSREKSIFTFPKGSQPGTCIHKIFEEIDFSETDHLDELIAENLALYGIDEHWKTIVSNMIRTVVHIPLLESSDTLKMSVLNERDMISEMEFYYQNEEIKSQKLLSIIRKKNQVHTTRGIAERGFLKGFIDLTFQFENKYYLLDYKTNYLGDSYDAYKADILQEEIYEASYDLQYHIYSIALHRFLSQKLPGYSYQKHFGGVFYLFLRGINKQGREGIFYDCPELSLISELNNYIGGPTS